MRANIKYMVGIGIDQSWSDYHEKDRIQNRNVVEKRQGREEMTIKMKKRRGREREK